MKKSISLFLCLVLLLTGCAGNPEQTTVPTDTPPPAQTTLPPETTLPEPTADPALEALRSNLPVMDGSTSLIPLEAGIRAALFGKTIEEATKDVTHTTSWDSFWNLLNGSADLIFSVPLSEQQYAFAEEQGVSLEEVPIAKEGFIFVVNGENPVDSLTQQQIRDIYSGKITNWKEVGGLDEPIIPYQRNTDSGSQNYMLAFMGDTPLMDAPTELRPASMAGLMDVIAVNDNSRAAIGYSVYAYAADMYGNGSEIKFIQVDGVAPSKAAFADGTYPLMGYNYAIFNADEPEDSYVRQLVDWMRSDEGQTAIARAGYVTMTDVGFDYSEATIEKYEAVGTGWSASEPTSSAFVLCHKVSTQYEWGVNETIYEQLIPEVITLPDGTSTYRITQLADDRLEAEINAWIDEQMVWALALQEEVQAHVQSLNKGDDYGRFAFYSWEVPEESLIGNSACIVTARNGILSVAVTLHYFENTMETRSKHYRTETASWNLLTGQALTPEDLFCEGVDIDQVLNAYIRAQTQTPGKYYGYTPETKADFASLPMDGWHLTHDTIYFDYGNPYFAHGEPISLNDLPDGILAADRLQDFSAALESDTAFVRQQFRFIERDIEYAYNADGLVSCGFLKEDVHPGAAKINAAVMDHLNTHFTEDAIRSWYEDRGYSTENLDLWMMDWYLQNWGGKYAFFRGYAPELYLEESDSFVKYPAREFFLFDIESGEELELNDLLKEGWEDAVECEEEIPFDVGSADCYSLYLDNGAGLQVWLTDGTSTCIVKIPTDYILY